MGCAWKGTQLGGNQLWGQIGWNHELISHTSNLTGQQVVLIQLVTLSSTSALVKLYWPREITGSGVHTYHVSMFHEVHDERLDVFSPLVDVAVGANLTPGEHQHRGTCTANKHLFKIGESTVKITGHNTLHMFNYRDNFQNPRAPTEENPKMPESEILGKWGTFWKVGMDQSDANASTFKGLLFFIFVNFSKIWSQMCEIMGLGALPPGKPDPQRPEVNPGMKWLTWVRRREGRAIWERKEDRKKKRSWPVGTAADALSLPLAPTFLFFVAGWKTKQIMKLCLTA